ncbi:MAG: hypothetical protein ACTSPS_16570 [Promethearchaeota archaeon]
MSYIEEKYKDKINEIFRKELPQWEEYLLELFNKKSITISDNVAKTCAEVNKNVNLILKKYYPEINELNDKLEIKSQLKFYYNLLDKLTDFIRNIENFQKLDDQYYEFIIDFINDKEDLISGKYTEICRQELTAFYDKRSRDNLENILAEKLERQERQFFAMGPLEEEIKKIGRAAGASQVSIFSAEERKMGKFKVIDNPQSIIHYTVLSDDEEKLKDIGREIRAYIRSKGYEAELLIVEFSDIITEWEGLIGTIITDADLLP